MPLIMTAVIMPVLIMTVVTWTAMMQQVHVPLVLHASRDVSVIPYTVFKREKKSSVTSIIPKKTCANLLNLNLLSIQTRMNCYI